MGGGGHIDGFTLAEVLITLSIIGVVAALTIPVLSLNNNEKETVVKLKKVYNTMSNAFSLATLQYGDPLMWGWTANKSVQGSNNAMDKIAPFLNILKRCNQGKGCFKADYVYKGLSGGDWQNWDGPNALNPSKAILSDGTNFLISSLGNNCDAVYGGGRLKETCGFVVVDLNGNKGPNIDGKDLFHFYISRSGIIPFGTKDDSWRPFESYCNGGDGSGCTAWVLLKENLNYPPFGASIN